MKQSKYPENHFSATWTTSKTTPNMEITTENSVSSSRNIVGHCIALHKTYDSLLYLLSFSHPHAYF